MNIRLFIFTFVLLTGFASCSTDDPAAPEDVQIFSSEKTVKDMKYGTDEEQVLDLYLPADRSSEATPVIILIHGGAWVQGDKASMRGYVSRLKQLHPEYAIANLNYRLADPPEQTAFPDQFLDLKQALEFISSRAEEWGVMAEFGLIGSSAGGHLAMQYDYEYDDRDQVKLVCSIVGPADFADPFYSENPHYRRTIEALVDEEAYPGVASYAKAVSPAYQVDANSSATILFYGEEDPLVPVTNAIFLQQQLEAAGVTNSLSIYEGGHGDWSTEDKQDLELQLSDFIETHLQAE